VDYSQWQSQVDAVLDGVNSTIRIHMVEDNAARAAFLATTDPTVFARQILSGNAPLEGAFHEPGKKILGYLRIALMVSAILMWGIAILTISIWMKNIFTGSPSSPTEIAMQTTGAYDDAVSHAGAIRYANVHLGIAVSMFGMGCLFALAAQSTSMIYRLGKTTH